MTIRRTFVGVAVLFTIVCRWPLGADRSFFSTVAAGEAPKLAPELITAPCLTDPELLGKGRRVDFMPCGLLLPKNQPKLSDPSPLHIEITKEIERKTAISIYCKYNGWSVDPYAKCEEGECKTIQSICEKGGKISRSDGTPRVACDLLWPQPETKTNHLGKSCAKAQEPKDPNPDIWVKPIMSLVDSYRMGLEMAVLRYHTAEVITSIETKHQLLLESPLCISKAVSINKNDLPASTLSAFPEMAETGIPGYEELRKKAIARSKEILGIDASNDVEGSSTLDPTLFRFGINYCTPKPELELQAAYLRKIGLTAEINALMTKYEDTTSSVPLASFCRLASARTSLETYFTKLAQCEVTERTKSTLAALLEPANNSSAAASSNPIVSAVDKCMTEAYAYAKKRVYDECDCWVGWCCKESTTKKIAKREGIKGFKKCLFPNADVSSPSFVNDSADTSEIKKLYEKLINSSVLKGKPLFEGPWPKNLDEKPHPDMMLVPKPKNTSFYFSGLPFVFGFLRRSRKRHTSRKEAPKLKVLEKFFLLIAVILANALLSIGCSDDASSPPQTYPLDVCTPDGVLMYQSEDEYQKAAGGLVATCCTCNTSAGYGKYSCKDFKPEVYDPNKRVLCKQCRSAELCDAPDSDAPYSGQGPAFADLKAAGNTQSSTGVGPSIGDLAKEQAKSAQSINGLANTVGATAGDEITKKGPQSKIGLANSNSNGEAKTNPKLDSGANKLSDHGGKGGSPSGSTSPAGNTLGGSTNSAKSDDSNGVKKDNSLMGSEGAPKYGEVAGSAAGGKKGSGDDSNWGANSAGSQNSGPLSFGTSANGGASGAAIDPAGTPDALDYFTRIGLEDNLFKIVTKKYQKKANQLEK